MRLTLKNDFDELTRLAEALTEFCGRHGVPDESRITLNVALEEIVTNIISYAFDGARERSIDLELGLRDGSLRAIVADDGIAYNPLQHALPDVTLPLEKRRIGGLGIVLITRLVDDVTYERTGGRNVLTISKRV
jgi:anti-sigma regulatory factor (Ser/Thr protein kinase)